MKSLLDQWIEMIDVRKRIRRKCTKLKLFKKKVEQRLRVLRQICIAMVNQLYRIFLARKRIMGWSGRQTGKMMQYRRWQRDWNNFLLEQGKRMKKAQQQEERLNRRLRKLHTELVKSPQRRRLIKKLFKKLEIRVATNAKVKKHHRVFTTKRKSHNRLQSSKVYNFQGKHKRSSRRDSNKQKTEKSPNEDQSHDRVALEPKRSRKMKAKAKKLPGIRELQTMDQPILKTDQAPQESTVGRKKKPIATYKKEKEEKEDSPLGQEKFLQQISYKAKDRNKLGQQILTEEKASPANKDHSPDPVAAKTRDESTKQPLGKEISFDLIPNKSKGTKKLGQQALIGEKGSPSTKDHSPDPVSHKSTNESKKQPLGEDNALDPILNRSKERKKLGQQILTKENESPPTKDHSLDPVSHESRDESKKNQPLDEENALDQIPYRPKDRIKLGQRILIEEKESPSNIDHSADPVSHGAEIKKKPSKIDYILTRARDKSIEQDTLKSAGVNGSKLKMKKPSRRESKTMTDKSNLLSSVSKDLLKIARLTGERDTSLVDTIKKKLRASNVQDRSKMPKVIEDKTQAMAAPIVPIGRPSQAMRHTGADHRKWILHKKEVMTGNKHAGAGLFEALEKHQHTKYHELQQQLSDVIQGPSMIDKLQDSTSIIESIQSHYMWGNLLSLFLDLKAVMPPKEIVEILKRQYTEYVNDIVKTAISKGALIIDVPNSSRVEADQPHDDSSSDVLSNSLHSSMSRHSSLAPSERQDSDEPLLELQLSEELKRMTDRYTQKNLKRIYDAHVALFGQSNSSERLNRFERKRRKQKQLFEQSKLQLEHNMARKQARVSPTRLYDAPRQTCRERKCKECNHEDDDVLMPKCERCGFGMSKLHVTPENSVTQFSLSTLEACNKNPRLIASSSTICWKCGFMHRVQQACPVIWQRQPVEKDPETLLHQRLIKEIASSGDAQATCQQKQQQQLKLKEE